MVGVMIMVMVEWMGMQHSERGWVTKGTCGPQKSAQLGNQTVSHNHFKKGKSRLADAPHGLTLYIFTCAI
jgi:hypothetical protein